MRNVFFFFLQVIKSRIEDLISREYIERDAESGDTYRCCFICVVCLLVVVLLLASNSQYLQIPRLNHVACTFRRTRSL